MHLSSHDDSSAAPDSPTPCTAIDRSGALDTTATMTGHAEETLPSAYRLSERSEPPNFVSFRLDLISLSLTNTDPSVCVEATREQMSEAKLPLAYRDSCANLLIPLNRCRFETYYLPWKCEVRNLPQGVTGEC